MKPALCRLLLLALALPAASASGQRRDTTPAVDPYTEGERAAMAAAGYVSFGPFTLGDGHVTTDVEHVLGEEARVLWVETAHFKIGSSLPEYDLPTDDRDERDKLQAELKDLHEVLPRVSARARTLDRWMRLHLFARRMEALYADFSERLGVVDADFPPKKAAQGSRMGKGPYLGQPGKYIVLLFEKESSAGTYARTFLHSEHHGTMRWNFFETGSLLYMSATEFGDGSLASDTAMHCEAVFNVTLNLLDGYRYYGHQMPFWFRQGLAHWFLRRVSPKHNVFAERRRFDNDPDMQWNWPPRVRARAGYETFPGIEELMEWPEEGHKTIVDAMMLWSRIDYLMTLGNEGFRAFVDAMKDAEGDDANATPSKAAQIAALARAWDLDPAAFDERWRRWVLQTYPKR